MPKLTALLLSLALLALNGCGGVKSRIKDHQREFDSYPAEAQAQIQSGRIDRGFTEDMVFLAKGEPGEKTTAELKGRKLVVWKYSRPNATPATAAGGNLAAPYGYPGFGPSPSQPTPLFYEKTYYRVYFDGGKVVDWDQGMQDDSGTHPGDIPEDLKMPATPYK